MTSQTLPITTLDGHLERITYFNQENYYTIAKLKTDKTRDLVTVVGHMALVSPGQSLRIKGTWETHPKYGQQFKIKSYEVTLPATVDGIRKYLESGVVKGIGPVTAERLVNRFGTETLEVIEKSPEKLLDVEGIGKTTAARIRDAWKDHHVARGLMQFLLEIGVAVSYSGKILGAYGRDAVSVIRRDPYQLFTDIPGISFYFADTIAQKLGVSKDEPRRVKACILQVMQQFINEGHVFSFEEQLLEHCRKFFQLDNTIVQDSIAFLSASGELVIEEAIADPAKRVVYLKELYQAEKGIAFRLNALLSVPVVAPDIDTERISAEVQKKLAITLSGGQLKVLKEVLSHRTAVITGGPGTGKTTLIKSINAIFAALGKHVLLAAPTGRAARRLSEVTGREAKTIHRLLSFNFKDGLFGKNQDDPLDADVVIIDEASMVDTVLMFHLIKAVPMTAVLILVGDVFQLPSVGPGNVLSDMIQSARTAVFYLKKIFRQEHESPIIVNAHRVRCGELPIFNAPDESGIFSEFCFIEQSDPYRVVATIVDLCTQTIPRQFGFDPVHDVQVLTPMHKGIVGTANLNQVLQKVLNSKPALVKSGGNTFKPGDKVMHLKNNYQKEVFNGDIGVITDIDSKKEVFSVDYYGRTVPYDFSEMDEISLAYATSVHKSQGSEYPAVIIPIMPQHFVLLQRNLLYTAITRGKKLVILIGTQRALAVALKNDKPRERLSGLAFRLAGSANGG